MSRLGYGAAEPERWRAISLRYFKWVHIILDRFIAEFGVALLAHILLD